MTLDALPLFGASVAAVLLYWCLPAKHGQNGVAAFTVATLALIAPATAAVMVASILFVQQALVWAERSGRRSLIAAVAIAAIGAVFLLSREIGTVVEPQWLFIGLAYSTLRHIHVIAEWRLGRIAVPKLGDYMRYHLLLPVLPAGPIHRLPHFERQCSRRRWSSPDFFSGAERALVGFTVLVVIGDYLIGAKLAPLVQSSASEGFFKLWASSAIDWIRIYVTFTGLTDFALGLVLMMGLRLEENFNKPWRARDLVDFWTRWHMTLSHWCRDYVYAPAAIAFRSPFLGLFCAMLVLGLWHQTSIYYVGWAVYQALGIVLSHGYRKAGDPLHLSRMPGIVRAILAPVAILAWVSSAQPVLTAFFGWTNS